MADWKSNVKELAEGFELIKVHTSQKDFAKTQNLTEKQMHMILKVYDSIYDREISSALTLESAYQILLKRKNEKRKTLMENLFN